MPEIEHYIRCIAISCQDPGTRTDTILIGILRSLQLAYQVFRPHQRKKFRRRVKCCEKKSVPDYLLSVLMCPLFVRLVEVDQLQTGHIQYFGPYQILLGGQGMELTPTNVFVPTHHLPSYKTRQQPRYNRTAHTLAMSFGN